MDTFHPFADDAAVRTIGDLTVENGTGRVVLHGSLEIGRDRTGLARARDLKRTLDAIVRALAQEELPEELPEEAAAEPASVGKARNPFA